MSDNNKPGIFHFDNFPFMDNKFGEGRNMIVCCEPMSGKTSLGLMQDFMSRHMGDKAKPDEGAPAK